jgi:hypothetical protein
MNNTSAYTETLFFHHILSDQIFLNTAKPEFFSNATLKDLFEVAKEHSIKYKEAPTKEQLSEVIKMKGLSEKYSDDIIEALFNTKEQLKQYDAEWLKENVGAWIQLRNLETVMRKSIAFMKTNATTTLENASAMVEKVRHMMATETAIDFSFDLGKDFFDPSSHSQVRLARTPTGYPYIDKCLKGGWWKGSLIVFIAQPKSGKCCVGDTYVNVRNKKTGEIKRIKMKELHQTVKNSYNTKPIKLLRDDKIYKIKNEDV